MTIRDLSTMFSSKTDKWSTPQKLFDELDAEFHFDMDVCATKEDTKCEKFISPEEDGLKTEWNGVCWCNPPYGRGIVDWVKKASEYKGTVVMLLFSRTDTKWFHDYVYHKAEIRFIKGRIKFGNSKENAPFPSMIVIFRGDPNV